MKNIPRIVRPIKYPGKRWRVVEIKGDNFHVIDHQDAPRIVHRSQVEQVRQRKTFPIKPATPQPPKYEQGELFGKSAFGVSKAKGFGIGIKPKRDYKFALKNKKRSVKYLVKLPKDRALDRYYSAKSRVHPKNDNSDELWDNGSNFRVSKIAMQPVFHGTSAAGATKLVRHIKSKTPDTSSFKFVTGTRAGKMGGDSRPSGLYTTTRRGDAEEYAVMGRSPQHSGLGFNRKNGKVLMFNAVGVKPKHRNPYESVYDPRDLGLPLATSSVKRRNLPSVKTLGSRVEPDAAAIRGNRRAVLSGKQKSVEDHSPPNSVGDFV